MSPSSFRLFRDGDAATWQAEIPLAGGGRPITIDTKTTDRPTAERHAAKIKRQREATRRWRSRQAAAAPEPAEVKPMPRRKTGRPRGRPPKKPVLDHQAISLRLRQLGGGGGDPPPEDDPLGPEDPTPVRPMPADAPQTPATDAPPLPPPEEPLTPEIVEPAADDEGQMFASLLAAGTVGGLMMVVREGLALAQPPRRPGIAHPIPVGWIERGLTNKYRKIIGDRQMSDGAAIFFGGVGVVVSMVFGSEVVSPPAAGDAPSSRSNHEAEGSEGRHAPPAAEPPPAPAPARALNGISHHRRGETPPPEDSALGKFR